MTCLAQNVGNVDLLTKRGLDHNSNLALLNNLNFEAKPIPNINPLPSPTPNIVNVGNPVGGTIPVTVNTENLALGNPNPVQFTYAPAFHQNLPQPLENNIIYFTGHRSQAPTLPFANVINSGIPLVTSTPNLQNGAVNNIQDNRNVLQTYVPQNVVEIPQSYPLQLIREVKVPQPYPVHITRTVQVPVQVRVPVEVPKPYPVKVPHPVPVPVHIKVPVTVEKPYPVQITKTVAVPVEKPVYIKVPQPIQVPVPQPYPVGVPQPVQVQVPFIVRFPEVPGQAPAVIPNLVGAPTPLVSNIQGAAPISGPLQSVPLSLDLSPIVEPKPVTASAPTTECNSCNNHNKESSLPTTTAKSGLPITGNGLVPPPLPTDVNAKPKTEEGLLNSYVSSKDGGVYRRGTEYQTQEYKKTW